MDLDAPHPVDPQWWNEALPRLRTFVRRRLRPELAQLEAPSDIVQSACRELLAALQREPQPRTALPGMQWRMVRVALRKIVQKHRYHAARKRNHLRTRGGDVDAVFDASTGPVGRLEEHERVQRLAIAMQSLSVNQQRVIEWVHFEGLSHAEVGRRLGRSEDASKMLLYRAMARLSELLGAP